MKQIILTMLFLGNLLVNAQHILHGRVRSSVDNSVLIGASITVSKTNIVTRSRTNGTFIIRTAETPINLKVSFIGYKQKEVKVSLPMKDTLTIWLDEDLNDLSEVVVSTGYEQIAKERITGSVATVDNALLNRAVGTNVLEHLQDVVPGLVFVRNASVPGRLNVNIRGQSTISGNTDPLIVVDNFAYDGDISAINPNDVENITVLKDAGAASIWGARAGNGVIVITTKKGTLQKPRVNVNSNFTFSAKPDAFFQPRMSSADYIDIQRRLFQENYYRSLELNDERNVSHAAIPPAVEIMIQQRDGAISDNEAEYQLGLLRSHDVRNDISQYLNQRAFNQRHAVNLSGGEENVNYYFSMGYDQSLYAKRGNEQDRISLLGNTSWTLLNKRLKLNAGFAYTRNNNQNNAPDFNPVEPYLALMDADGMPAAIPNYRDGFIRSTMQKGLLDWYNRPLDELGFANNTRVVTDSRFNLGAKMNLLEGLDASVLYQYLQTHTRGQNLYGQDTYYTRNLINIFTQIDEDGNLSRAIPLGGIMDRSSTDLESHNIRTQLNYRHSFDENNELTGLAGYEVKAVNTESFGYRLYGYNDMLATSQIVDYVTAYPNFSSPNQKRKIENRDSQTSLTDHFISYYANLAYILMNRYTITASSRLDQSNLFGVKTNQKGVPLYSVGASWNVARENFYKWNVVNDLKLRISFGYNGNIDKSLSAYTTARYWPATGYPNNLTGQPYATIVNPPNPELRWERVRIINYGVDFSALNNRVNVTADLYRKKGMDLIGKTPFPPSTGITEFKGNDAETFTKGLDLNISTKNLVGDFTWQTDCFLSVANDKVTAYDQEATATNYLINVGTPMVGKPLYAVYSYEWAGLSAENGDPMGYLNGVPSNNYLEIINSATPQTIMFHGSMRPTVFGSFRNTFTYHDFSLSFNISYRWNYYFRRPSIVYGADYGLKNAHGDYALRWQKPGDELTTSVPSVPTASNARRDSFYGASSVLVEKGNHIRLQDINLNYTMTPKANKLPFRTMQIYAYLNNLGLLYKASKSTRDPDYYLTGRPPFSISFGAKINF